MERNSRLNHLVQTYFGSTWVFCFFLVLIFLRFLFPGNTSFLNDEAMLFELALQAYDSGDLMVQLGLKGTRGFRYGPFGATFYLWLMYLTKNIYSIVVLKNLIITLMTILGLSWVIKSIKDVDKSIWLFVFLSPYLFLYSRMLWDNPFLVPLTSLCIGAYLQFIADRKILFFYIAVLTACLSVLTHLMVIPLCLALGVHFVFFMAKDEFKRWPHYIVPIALAGILLFPYLSYVVANRSEAVKHTFDMKSLWFPLYGVKFYSMLDLEYIFGKRWENLISETSWLFYFFRGLKLTGYFLLLFIPIGWGRMIKNFLKYFRIQDHQVKRSLHFDIAVLCLCTLVFHLILCLYGDLNKHPHYFNGVWIIHFFVLLYGLDTLKKIGKWGQRLKVFYLAKMSVLLICIVMIHSTHQGVRSRRVGANLKEQVKIASQLNRYPADSVVEYKTFHLAFSNLPISILRRLSPAEEVAAEKKKTSLAVEYKFPPHEVQKKGFAQLQVIEISD